MFEPHLFSFNNIHYTSQNNEYQKKHANYAQKKDKRRLKS